MHSGPMLCCALWRYPVHASQDERPHATGRFVVTDRWPRVTRKPSSSGHQRIIRHGVDLPADVASPVLVEVGLGEGFVGPVVEFSGLGDAPVGAEPGA